MNPTEIRQLIMQGLPTAEVRVSSNDGTHFEAQVVDASFEGKPALARHKLVYAILGERMGHEIHALSLSTLTPEERQRRQNRSSA